MSDPLYLRGCQGCRESWVATLWTDGPLCLRCRGRAERQPDTREEIAAAVAVRYPGKGPTCEAVRRDGPAEPFEPGRSYGKSEAGRKATEDAERNGLRVHVVRRRG